MNETCGNCKYGQMNPKDFSKRFCGGLPPFPIAVPTAKGMVVQQVQPIREATDKACALFKPRISGVANGA